jgi:3-hydroxyisobutyrate dehydrogenase-like beta-hydroxyacid dehydrogenase
MSEMERIGMIGVGFMGHGIAKNILLKGFPLTVLCHQNRKPVDDLLSRGAREAGSAAELTKVCDLILICVTGSPQVEEIVLGANGIIGACRPGLIVVDCSTSRPDSTLHLAEQLMEKGGTLVDAPLTRTPKEAEEGRLNVMVGADDTTFARVRPIIAAFAENIFHIGPTGTGHKIKLLNNFLALGAATVTAEAAVMAKAYGVDVRKLFDLVSAGGANSAMFQMCMPWVLEGNETRAKFSINNAHKDMTYLSELIAQDGRLYRALEAVCQTLTMARERGFGDNFLPRLLDAVGQEHGVNLGRD